MLRYFVTLFSVLAVELMVGIVLDIGGWLPATRPEQEGAVVAALVFAVVGSVPIAQMWKTEQEWRQGRKRRS